MSLAKTQATEQSGLTRIQGAVAMSAIERATAAKKQRKPTMLTTVRKGE